MSLWSKKEDTRTTANEYLNSLPLKYQLGITFASGVIMTSCTARVYRRYLRRIRNSEWVTPDIIKKKRWLKGKVTRYIVLDVLDVYYY